MLPLPLGVRFSSVARDAGAPPRILLEPECYARLHQRSLGRGRHADRQGVPAVEKAEPHPAAAPAVPAARRLPIHIDAPGAEVPVDAPHGRERQKRRSRRSVGAGPRHTGWHRRRTGSSGTPAASTSRPRRPTRKTGTSPRPCGRRPGAPGWARPGSGADTNASARTSPAPYVLGTSHTPGSTSAIGRDVNTAQRIHRPVPGVEVEPQLGLPPVRSHARRAACPGAAR